MENNKSVALALPDEVAFKRDIMAINRFQQVVHSNMVAGQDYGVIPGTTKPTLLKPGAEKIAKLLGLADQYEILDRQEDWNKPFFRYLIKCSLISVAHGTTISEGLGECNSMEAKYRWRESKRKCPACGAEAIIKGKTEYGGGWICFKKAGGCGAKWEDGDVEIESQSIGRVENDDIYSQVNTILKMSKKRALVDAALSAGRLSNVFTQDIEDMGAISSANIPEHEEVKATSSDKDLPQADQVTDAQRKKIFASAKQMGYEEEEIKEIIKAKWDVDSTKDLTKSQASDLIGMIEKGESVGVKGDIAAPPEEAKDTSVVEKTDDPIF